MLLEFADAARLYVPLNPPRSRSEVPLLRGRQTSSQPSRHASLVQDEITRQEGHARYGRRTSQALRRAQNRRRDTPSRRATNGSRVRRRLRIQRNRRFKPKPSKTLSRTWNPHSHGPPALRRRRLWQNRSLHGARFQSHQTTTNQVAVLAPTTRPRLPALRDFQAALRSLSSHNRDDQPLSVLQRSKKKFLQKTEAGKIDVLIGNPPHPLQRHQVLRSRPSHRRRRTALRASATKSASSKCASKSTSSPCRHAHSAHLAHVSGRPARYERDRKLRERSHGRSRRSSPLGRKTDPICIEQELETRRPGLLRPQPVDTIWEIAAKIQALSRPRASIAARTNVGRRLEKSCSNSCTTKPTSWSRPQSSRTVLDIRSATRF